MGCDGGGRYEHGGVYGDGGIVAIGRDCSLDRGKLVLVPLRGDDGGCDKDGDKEDGDGNDGAGNEDMGIIIGGQWS